EVDWREGEDCRTEADVCWIDSLSGTKRTRQMLEDGEGAEAIVLAWRREMRRFELSSKRYRLYCASPAALTPTRPPWPIRHRRPPSRAAPPSTARGPDRHVVPGVRTPALT